MQIQLITCNKTVIVLRANSLWEACKDAQDSGFTIVSATVLGQ